MTLTIEGMSCQACVRRVKAALQSIPGISVDKVEVGSATVQGEADPQQILDAVKKAGYTAAVE